MIVLHPSDRTCRAMIRRTRRWQVGQESVGDVFRNPRQMHYTSRRRRCAGMAAAWAAKSGWEDNNGMGFGRSSQRYLQNCHLRA